MNNNPLWKRQNAEAPYRNDDGICVYADICTKCNDKCNPENCDTWESFYDGECQADEILSE